MVSTLLNQLIVIFLAVFVMSACSAVKFSTKTDCGGDTNCVVDQGSLVHQVDFTVQGGNVDVLFVNDNSASMSYEQARLANRLNQFVARFDQMFINYRMAVTTSDISSANNAARAINQNGALQDGRLIRFSGNTPYLTQSSGSALQREQMFRQVINRPETLNCENFITNWISSGRSRDTSEYSQAYAQNCPSTDERGIYAANLVVKNNPDSFLRPEADLHIIFLADEDVRSQLYWSNTPGYALADYDKGDRLLPNIKSLYPQKTVGLHAIIVRDANCLAAQNSQLAGVVSGSYGWEYHKATQSTSGVSGNICANDYSQQLQSIFDNIQGQIIDKIALKCSGSNLVLNVNDILLTPADPTVIPSIVGAEIQFNKKVPRGTNVNFSYRCLSTAQ